MFPRIAWSVPWKGNRRSPQANETTSADDLHSQFSDHGVLNEGVCVGNGSIGGAGGREGLSTIKREIPHADEVSPVVREPRGGCHILGLVMRD